MEYLKILFSDDIKELKPIVNNKQYLYLKPKNKKKNKFQEWINNNPREYANILLQRPRFYNDTDYYRYVSEKSTLSLTTVRKHFLK